jgi:hypothetical protein
MSRVWRARVSDPTVCAACYYAPNDARYRPWYEWLCGHENAKLGVWFNPVTGQTIADPPRVKCKTRNPAGKCPDWQEGKNVMGIKVKTLGE